MRWLPLDAARKLLTSASDKKVLDSFVAAPRDTRPLLLVRHAATATPAGRLKGRAVPPRLSKSGRAQAQALVPVLEGLGVTRLLSADLPACAQTLAPFAASSGVAVHRRPPDRRRLLGQRAGSHRRSTPGRRGARDRRRLRAATSDRRPACGPGRGVGVRLPAETGVRRVAGGCCTTGTAPSVRTRGTSPPHDDKTPGSGNNPRNNAGNSQEQLSQATGNRILRVGRTTASGFSAAVSVVCSAGSSRM